MLRRFLSTLILLPILGLLVYTVLLTPAGEPSRASQDPTVVNKTTGCEIEAEIVGNEVTITLKNNHKETVTAFTIGFDNTHGITEDFAYSEVHSGIAPGDVFQKRYPLPLSFTGSVPTLYLLTALLQSGSEDGSSQVAQKIKDERLGEKIQVLRTVRILEKQKNLPNDLRVLKADIIAALDTAESETLITLNELQPADTRSGRMNNKLSDDVRKGLKVGREKMLRRLEAVEQFPNERERAFMEFKTRSNKLLTKL